MYDEVKDKVRFFLNSNNRCNGLLQLILDQREMSVDLIEDKVLYILNTGDVSDLKFGKLDFSNDIKTVEQFADVLFKDGVVWRQYKDSWSAYAGIVFGNGRKLANFRWYGFQYFENISGNEDCGSYYVHTLDKMKAIDCNVQTKINLLNFYVKAIDTERYAMYKEDILDYLTWFATSYLMDEQDKDFLISLDHVRTELEFNSVKANLNTYGEEVPEVGGFDWRLVNSSYEEWCESVINRFECTIPMKIVNGELYINGKRTLSKEVTKLFLALGRQQTQLECILLCMAPELRGYGLEFSKVNEGKSVERINAF